MALAHRLGHTGVGVDPRGYARSIRGRRLIRKILLVAGIVSSLLYVAMNILVAMQWEEYSSASQTVSELSAIGAPTRALWVPLGIVYSLLVIAFGCGVWASALRNRPLRIVGRVMVGYGVVSLAWPFAPMHLRGAGFTLTDAMHIVLAMVTVLLMLLAMGVGAAAFERRFRLYSVVTIVILVGCGALTALDSPRIAANLSTPWIGVWERINIGAYLLWVIVLASTLLRSGTGRREREGHLCDGAATVAGLQRDVPSLQG